MPTDPVSALPQRQIWLFAMFLFWGAFELGRWTEAAEPWAFSAVFSGCIGAFMVMAAIFGLRDALRQVGTRSGTNATAR